MSEDLAFRIQLGIVLPKMKEKIGGEFATIVNELVEILKSGTREGEELDAAPIKEILMKDVEIFIDEAIMPGVVEMITPPPAEASEEAAEEAPAEE